MKTWPPQWEDVPREPRWVFDSAAQMMKVDPKDFWDWWWKLRPAPQWFVERVTTIGYPTVDPAYFGLPLPSVENRAIVRREMQTENSTKRLGRPPTDHPFTRALHEKGMSVAEWAVAHEIPPPTVSSWFLGKNARRKIPMSVAQQIEKELGVPLDAWKNGIRYDLKKKL